MLDVNSVVFDTGAQEVGSTKTPDKNALDLSLSFAYGGFGSSTFEKMSEVRIVPQRPKRYAGLCSQFRFALPAWSPLAHAAVDTA